MIELSSVQRSLVEAPAQGTIFLEGAAGTGKTTVGVQRLRYLRDTLNVPGHQLLVFVSQRTLGLPYEQVIRQPGTRPGTELTIVTLGSLALQSLKLYWPLVSDTLPVGAADTQPTFLSLETAQYIMARLVDPLIEREGYFESIRVDRNRLYSQLIDNLNKAALVGFDYNEIGKRLGTALAKEPGDFVLYNQVQTCIEKFRDYCRENSLLDFSLQIELYRSALLPRPEYREALFGQYRHLIIDNIEEDNPTSHALMRDWIGHVDSGLVIYDQDAGFRIFLGANPATALDLADSCDTRVTLTESFVTSEPMQGLAAEFAQVMQHETSEERTENVDPSAALDYEFHRFYPEILNWVADEIERLVKDEQVEPGNIVVLAPFLSDALRFTLTNRLTAAHIPVRSHRPSRALREETATRCMLTFALLAHPEWGIKPDRYDLTYAFMQALATIEPGRGLDLVRAQLLAENALYDAKTADPASKTGLKPFALLPTAVQERVTYLVGERYDALREWLESSINGREQVITPPPPAKTRGRKKKAAEEPAPEPVIVLVEDELDHFFTLLFGEVLSQEGFGLHQNFEAANIISNLIDSARNFRRTMSSSGLKNPDKSVGQEYVEMVARGLIADQYVRQWSLDRTENSVLLAPAYTFLLNNQPVRYQFWLDVGNRGWFSRLLQPLTHPVVLSANWVEGAQWGDELDVENNRETLYRLVTGLLRRCRDRVYLGLSELGESGYESQGEFLMIIQRVMRRLNAGKAAADV